MMGEASSTDVAEEATETWDALLAERAIEAEEDEEDGRRRVEDE